MGMKKFASIVGAVMVLAAAGGVAVAAPASAAPVSVQSVGTCTTTKEVTAKNNPTAQYMVNVPVTSAGNRDCRLEQGNVSGAVTRLQNALRSSKCGVGSSIAADGQFGPATKSALIQMQKKLGIGADGIYGTQTANAMTWDQFTGGCSQAK